MNELIFFISIVAFLFAAILMYKLFGKYGLYAYVVFGSLLANIAAMKTVTLFGFTTTAGSVLYASTFLCTDILSEKYGKKSAGMAVILGIITSVLWLFGTQVTLLFNPTAQSEFISDKLDIVFGMIPRLTIASLTGYIFSQSIDVFMYHYIWNKTGNSKKGLWIRNNGSTLTSQLFDTVIFASIAYLGTMDLKTFFEVLITTYIFKAIVALCDTPFAYLARLVKPLDIEAKIDNEENNMEEEKCLD
jgi:uncharacterized integral membrane protein (TIGR00697 family)